MLDLVTTQALRDELVKIANVKALAIGKRLAKRPLPPSVRGLKPKAEALKKVDFSIDPKQMASWAGKTSTASVKLSAKLPPQAKASLEALATRLAKSEKKVPQKLVMKSLGGGGGLISGRGKAAVMGLK